MTSTCAKDIKRRRVDEGPSLQELRTLTRPPARWLSATASRRTAVLIILAPLRGAVGIEQTTPGVACAPPGANLLPALRAGFLHAGGVRAIASHPGSATILNPHPGRGAREPETRAIYFALRIKMLPCNVRRSRSVPPPLMVALIVVSAMIRSWPRRVRSFSTLGASAGSL